MNSLVSHLLKDSEIPGVHLVPAAIANTTVQAPFAQRWNPVPSTQFHNPSDVHFVPGLKDSIDTDSIEGTTVLMDSHVEKAGVGSSEDLCGSAVGDSLEVNGLLHLVGSSTKGPERSAVSVLAFELSIWVREGHEVCSVALMDWGAHEPSGGALSDPW